MAFLHSRGNARTWHRHERILSPARGNTGARDDGARAHAHTRGPFIYVLVVTPALRSVTIMPSYFISQHPTRLELLLPFCLLRFALACSYSRIRVHSRINYPPACRLFIRLIRVSRYRSWELCDIELSLVAPPSMNCGSRDLYHTCETIFHLHFASVVKLKRIGNTESRRKKS